MAIVQVKANTTKIPLGRQGENTARRIQFNLSSWQAEYGAGTPALIHKRCGDSIAYPVPLTVEGVAAYWDVTSADTENPGIGKCELTYHFGESGVSKTITYQTIVEASMNDEIGFEPQAVPSWVDAVNHAIAEANSATQAATEAAEAANKAAENAGSSSGELSSDSVADDEDVTEMLNEVFGVGPTSEAS